MSYAYLLFFFMYAYRDIKGANLLVDSAGVVKLADFGMAKHVSSKSPPLFDLHFLLSPFALQRMVYFLPLSLCISTC